jgi:uncharacterized protein (TIGR00369 family)
VALLGWQREFGRGGRSRRVMEPRPELGNVIGAMHGGVVLTLLDVAMASAAVSRHDFRLTAVTLNLDTSFINPGRGRLTADGELLDDDGSVALCSARVTDAGGQLVAQALGSFRYLPLPQTPLPEGDTP